MTDTALSVLARRNRAAKEAFEEAVVAARFAGRSYGDIAADAGMTKAGIHGIVKRRGGPTEPTSPPAVGGPERPQEAP